MSFYVSLQNNKVQRKVEMCDGNGTLGCRVVDPPIPGAPVIPIRYPEDPAQEVDSIEIKPNGNPVPNETGWKVEMGLPELVDYEFHPEGDVVIREMTREIRNDSNEKYVYVTLRFFAGSSPWFLLIKKSNLWGRSSKIPRQPSNVTIGDD